VRFCGNEICCGSYACLNAIRDKNLDPQLFEITTSAPFGIRHFENSYFDRLLTTYQDPGKGMDAALRLWGYAAVRYEVQTVGEAIEILKERLRDDRAVLGPIDMGSLGYQVMPRLLKRMDHYVTLEYWSEDAVLCYDSEGFGGCLIRYEELQDYISVEEVFEAEGVITLRFIQKAAKEYQREEILERARVQAFRNLRKAEEEGEGSEAVLRCYDFLKGQDVYKWKLPLMYDIQYLMQRKWLMKVLSQNYREVVKERDEFWEKVDDIVDMQIRTAGEVYRKIWLGEGIVKRDFEVVGECEKRLAGIVVRLEGDGK